MPTFPPAPSTDFVADGSACHRSGSLIWVPLRSRWVDTTHAPEEVVRQDWVRRLVVEGGFDLSQMAQEKRTQHGHGSPRADIVIWNSAEARSAGVAALMVVETKATEGGVIESDFRQGASYATAGGAGFLIAATATAYAVYEMKPGFPGMATQINDWPKRADFADPRRLDKLKHSLRVFDRDEFQKLLADCHDLLRDHHAMTPDKAFDTISKILFIKLSVERRGTARTFRTDFLDAFESTRINQKVSAHEELFNQTKEAFRGDELFAESDRLDISDATFRAIVAKLERFNLSKTGDDIKGIAFEQFLGRTFRGELGQFFTPRPVVDFMVEALDPQEGELVCDPAAGSGGFLIRVFDHIRGAISADIERQKTEAFERISSDYPEDATEDQLAERDQRIDEAFAALNADLLPMSADGQPAETRVGKLARKCIYGTDKEPRAARTAKMNMIMHGDGHGGIHAHDGLVNINGVWEERFNVIVTNPPFGATVTNTQLVGATRESDVPDDLRYSRRQTERYGDAWQAGHRAVVQARHSPILDTFEIGRGKKSRQTEVLFVERVLRLLKSGGRAAIILPNGNLNAVSLGWLRRWTEGNAYLRGVVALPVETFKFSKASVSASIVFLQKFTDEDREVWNDAWLAAALATNPDYDAQRQAALTEIGGKALTANGAPDVIELIEKLQALGVVRKFEGYTRVPNNELVRNSGTTKLGNVKWHGRAVGEAASLKKELAAALKTHSKAVKAAEKELRAKLREIDVAQTAAMWAHVRQHFDYEVFMAAPVGVGITATGETGAHVPNDLPEVLTELRRFRPWRAGKTSEDGF
ncbi:restriction endonuclease subunit M [Streptomyces sp. NPDC048225]|uniref:restriction endonuclease subunit M n=1 Tax=Streptomyces sp. NPDC048225 TaxID=3365518 RepID=UPI003723B330